MTFTLNEDIRYCIANDRPAFLDLANDRYFCLPSKLEATFQASLRNDGPADPSNPSLVALLTRGILVEGNVTAMAPVLGIPTPNRDCWESEIEGRAHIDHVTALACYGAAKMELRLRRLKAIAGAIEVARVKKPARRPLIARRLVSTEAMRFRQIRAIVKVHDKCLIWSLAMLRYLFLKGFDPHLVIGVRLEPFSAHAWVQSGDLVLSCPVDEARLYTPILVA